MVITKKMVILSIIVYEYYLNGAYETNAYSLMRILWASQILASNRFIAINSNAYVSEWNVMRIKLM